MSTYNPSETRWPIQDLILSTLGSPVKDGVSASIHALNLSRMSFPIPPFVFSHSCLFTLYIYIWISQLNVLFIQGSQLQPPAHPQLQQRCPAPRPASQLCKHARECKVIFTVFPRSLIHFHVVTYFVYKMAKWYMVLLFVNLLYKKSKCVYFLCKGSNILTFFGMIKYSQN